MEFSCFLAQLALCPRPVICWFVIGLALQRGSMPLVFHSCVPFAFSKVFHVTLSGDVSSGEAPFHPRGSGGTQEENGHWGAQEKAGRSASGVQKATCTQGGHRE